MQDFANKILENYKEFTSVLRNTLDYGLERLGNLTRNETKLAVATLLNFGELDPNHTFKTKDELENVNFVDLNLCHVLHRFFIHFS